MQNVLDWGLERPNNFSTRVPLVGPSCSPPFQSVYWTSMPSLTLSLLSFFRCCFSHCLGYVKVSARFVDSRYIYLQIKSVRSLKLTMPSYCLPELEHRLLQKRGKYCVAEAQTFMCLCLSHPSSSSTDWNVQTSPRKKPSEVLRLPRMVRVGSMKVSARTFSRVH